MSSPDPAEVCANVGRRIAELRRERNMTQAEFAAVLKTSTQWLSRVELGEENLTVYTLVKIASALGVEVPSLFEAPQELMPNRRGRPPKR